MYRYLLKFFQIVKQTSLSHLHIPSTPQSAPIPIFDSRAQEVFRQAMRCSVVHLDVVPSSNRERYEKSVIGQVLGNSTGPDHSPRSTKTKEPPPPIKAKPVFRPAENPATRLMEDAANLEAPVSVSCTASNIGQIQNGFKFCYYEFNVVLLNLLLLDLFFIQADHFIAEITMVTWLTFAKQLA